MEVPQSLLMTYREIKSNTMRHIRAEVLYMPDKMGHISKLGGI